MKLKITRENETAINAEIRKSEGTARVRLITYENVVKAVEMATANPMVAILTKRLQVGITASYRRYVCLPAAYKYPAEATYCNIEKRRDAWYLVKVFRARCNSEQSEQIKITISQKQAEVAQERLLDTVCVRR